MDLRKQKSTHLRNRSKPGVSGDGLRDRSPYGADHSNERMGLASGDAGVSDQRQYRYEGQQQRLTSPEEDSQARIEARHEELKRQIVLKERQLAEMTSERDTADRLRSKLGLQRNSFNNQSGTSINNTSKRSNSPLRTGMGGYRSTHMRQQQQQPTEDLNQRERSPMIHGQYGQPLQFHPQPIQRQPSQQSPLRSRSRSGGPQQQEDDFRVRERADTSFNNAVSAQRPPMARTYNDKSVSPYHRAADINRTLPPRASHQQQQQPQRNSSSPLRHSRSPPRNDSQYQSREVIKPQPIQQTQNLVSTGAYTQHQPDALGSTDMSRFTGPDARGQLYKDRIEAMTIDNASLQRRLNQVATELERIQREREDLSRQLNKVEGENNHYERQINNKDETDMNNQVMQEDLERHKEQNKILQTRVKEEELDAANTGEKLTSTGAAKKNLELESESLNMDLGKKLRHLDDISQHRFQVLQDVQNTSNELEHLSRQQLQQNHENIDLEAHISRLMQERHELLRNLEQLTITYDDCVRDITRERRNMDAQNDWQTKLIVTKIVFENIQLFQNVRKQNSFRELTEYVRFDKDCHLKLRSFSNVIYKLGQYKMRIALNQWYDKALKPLNTRLQNDDISIMVDCNRLQAKVFYAWRQYQQDKLDRYYFKTNAIDKIWYLLNKSAKQELKRAVSIWREKKQFDQHKVSKFRDLLVKCYKGKLSRAVNLWQTHSNYMGHSVRVRILQIEYTQKFYLSQVFSQFKMACRNEKRLRMRTLNTYVKAWKDHISYNRHLMQANMASITFGKVNRNFILRNCFDELRQNRETRKYTVMDIEVKENMNVAIAECEQFNVDKEKAILTKSQYRAGSIVTDVLGKRLWGYFAKWRLVNEQYKNTLNTKVKDRIYKMYYNYMRSYFQHWQEQIGNKSKQKRKFFVQDLESMNEAMQKEALEGDRVLRAQAEAVRTQKRKMVDKTFKKLFYRQLAVALGRWRDRCGLLQNKEQRAEIILKKLRTRLLGDAFLRYLQFYRKSIQHDRNIQSGACMKATLELKEMRKVFNALCFETNRQKKSKQYWSKIFTRLDHFMKQRAIKRWIDNAHSQFESKLDQNQKDIMAQIQQYKESINHQEQDDHTQNNFIDDQFKLRRKKAYRQIGNYFMRNYTRHISQKFRLWKDHVSEMIHKEHLLKRTVYHFEKCTFLSVQQAFRKFVSIQRQIDFNSQIRNSELEQQKIITQQKFEMETQDKRRDEETAIIQEYVAASQKKQEEYRKLMEVHERRAIEWQYGSKKRMVLKMWRHVYKQEKAFVLCVKNVIEKSMAQRFFNAVNQRSREVRDQRFLHYALKKYTNRNFQMNAQDAFTAWKKSALNVVETRKHETHDVLQEQSNQFEEFVQTSKDINNERCFKYFIDNRKSDIWKAWVNVIKQLKLTKMKTAEFEERQSRLRRQFALQRWNARAKKTMASRAKVNLLKRSFTFKYHLSSFNALKTNYLNVKHLCQTLSNLEKMMRDKTYGDSFKDIRTFAVSKGLVLKNRRLKGTQDIISLLQQAYLKRMQTEFNSYKAKTEEKHRKRNKLKTVWGKFIALRTRDAFEWWRRNANKAELSKELHESGPVRAEYWAAEKEIANLKEFMAKEHFTENEIEGTCKKVFGRNEQLMKKYMIRLRIRQDQDRKILPLIWNRWREYVGIRKLVKFQFKFMENSVDNVKADLQRAFKKWRNGPDQLARELWRLPLETITELGIKSTKQVAECGDQLAENQSIQSHLLIQRDEFLNYYVKSQILALAYVKDRSHFAKMQSWSRWLQNRRKMNKNDLETAIRDAAYIQANLETRQKELSESNEYFTKENGELGQFTDDGVIIRKNMERLKDERDKLAAQYNDVDKDYQDLLEENERLQKEVADALQKAQDNPNTRFQNVKSMKSKKEPSNETLQAEKEKPETEEEKAKRLRFERLNKISQGAGLR